MKNKIGVYIKTALACVSAALVFSACGGQEETGTPQATAQSSPTQSVPTQAAAEAALPSNAAAEAAEAEEVAPTEAGSPTDGPSPTPRPTSADRTEVVVQGELATENEVSDVLEQNRSKAKKLNFICTQALYDTLSANSFGKLELLMLKAGVTGDVYYSSSVRKIELRNFNSTGMAWKECSNETDIKKAIAEFAEAKQYAFTLICPTTLASGLKGGTKLYNYAAQAGYEDITLSVKGNGCIEFKQGKFFAEPYSVVSSADEFSAAVKGYAEKEENKFYIIREYDFNEKLKQDTRSATIMVDASMLEKYTCSSSKSGLYHYTNVTYTKDPKTVCYSDDDVVKAIKEMGKKGAKDFRLYLVGDLIEKLSSSDWKGLHELEIKGGLSSTDMSYSVSGTVREIKYSKARIAANPVSFSTMDAVISYVEKEVRAGTKEITLFCTASLYQELIGDLDNRFAVLQDGMTKICDLVAHAGILDLELGAYRTWHSITLDIENLYPGLEIALAVENGKEKELSSQLQKTLTEAQKMAKDCKSTDPRETAMAIHDAICKCTEYETRNSRSDNDTAVGVLLNGKADCDGYADAFYLVGMLAGLEVRYQHGDGKNSSLSDFFNTATHMWNLVKLKGSWRAVDLTWDDSEKDVQYTWFDLGKDRARRDHKWNEDMTPALLEKTDLSKRPENEFSVKSLADVQKAVKTAYSKNYSTFMFVFDDENYTDEQAARNEVQKQFNKSFKYSSNKEMRMLTIYMK